MALPLLAGIAAAAKVAGNIAGGAAQAKAYRDRINDLRAQQQENKNWFDKNYNEDFLHRRSAQALLNQQEESIRERNRQAQAQAAVMGGSQAAVAAQKQANNAALATTANVLSQQEEARKDNIENQYMLRRDNLNQQIDAARQGKAQNVANAMVGVGNAAGDFISNNLIKK